MRIITQKTGPPKDLRKNTRESLPRGLAEVDTSKGSKAVRIAPVNAKIKSGFLDVEVLRLGEIAQM